MIKIGMLVLLCFLITTSSILAQQTDKTITGQILEIDSVSRKLTLRHNSYRGGNPDQITFLVPKDAQIIRGTSNISFLNINVSDRVTVTYYSDDLSGLKIRRLEDHNMGNR